MPVTMSYPRAVARKTLTQLSDTTRIFITVESVAKQDDIELIQLGAVHHRTMKSCHVIFPPSQKRAASRDGYLDFIRMIKNDKSGGGCVSKNESQFTLLLRKDGRDRAAASKLDAWEEIVKLFKDGALPNEKFTLIFYSMFEMISFMHANLLRMSNVKYIACVTSEAKFIPMPDLFYQWPVKDNSMGLAAWQLKKLALDSTLVPSITCFQMINYTEDMFKMRWLDPNVYYLLSCHGVRSSDGFMHQSSMLQLDLQLSPTRPPECLLMNGTNKSGKRSHECNSSSQQPKKRKLNLNPDFKELGTRLQMPVRKEAKEHQNDVDAPVDQKRLDIFLAKCAFSMSETENIMKENNEYNECNEFNQTKLKNDSEMRKKKADLDKNSNEVEIIEIDSVANKNPNDKESRERETIADANIRIQKEALQNYAKRENIGGKETKNDLSKTVVDKILEHLMDTSSKDKQVKSDQKSNHQKNQVSHPSVSNDEVMATSAHGGMQSFRNAQEVYVISDNDSNVSSAVKNDNQMVDDSPVPGITGSVEKPKGDHETVTFNQGDNVLCDQGDHDTPSYNEDNHDTASHNRDNPDTIPQVDEAQQKEVDLMIELKAEKLKLLNELEDLLKKRRQYNAFRANE